MQHEITESLYINNNTGKHRYSIRTNLVTPGKKWQLWHNSSQSQQGPMAAEKSEYLLISTSFDIRPQRETMEQMCASCRWAPIIYFGGGGGEWQQKCKKCTNLSHQWVESVQAPWGETRGQCQGCRGGAEEIREAYKNKRITLQTLNMQKYFVLF